MTRTYTTDQIRNFCIIAHIDHGKSTLADRLIEKTGAVSQRKMTNQHLDSMELEKEKGITIKLKAVKLFYQAQDGQGYVLNLIDTPGHVDFNYEVSRSLAACEGAILIVDASQGVEAQTVGNTYLALEEDLEILPVINKIDLPGADVDFARREIEEVLGMEAEDAPAISAKNGINIDSVLEYIVRGVPAPQGHPEGPLKALIFDSYYDPYRGVVLFVRVIDGSIRAGSQIQLMATGKEYGVDEVGYVSEEHVPCDCLITGDVGYITGSIKNVGDARVGDTITEAARPAKEALPGYKKVMPMVYAGIYPTENESVNSIREALEKLQVNDAALTFEKETSIALGFGFRCGFLGMLHMEIIQERLIREFDLDMIVTAPSVIYQVSLHDGRTLSIQNPADFPDPTLIASVREPIVQASIMTPKDYIGAIMELCEEKRGIYKTMEYLDERRLTIHYELPLNEVIYDFFDALKSRTRGFASLDYEFKEYRTSDLVKLDILVNEQLVDALSLIVHRSTAYDRGRTICERLKKEIPRHQFAVPIQAAIGGKIIARETVSAMRKDVIAKCYGGDISRKKKLLEKQKEGKKRMRQIGSVSVPQSAFLSVLKYEEEE